MYILLFSISLPLYLYLKNADSLCQSITQIGPAIKKRSSTFFYDIDNKATISLKLINNKDNNSLQ